MRLKKCLNGADYIRSESMFSVHGFSTRMGGMSTLSHTSSLNLAFGRGDERETVLENLRIFAEAVGFDPKRLVSVSQIHSADVVCVDESHVGQGYFIDECFECDGYVTKVSGITLGVKTADCVPILMEGYDSEGKVCAVGAVHAGWKGTVNGIAAACLEKLVGLGALRESVRVAIGPAICGDCFEVRRDFYDAVREVLGESITEKFVIPDRKRLGVWHCDLRAMNREFLISAGVKAENIDISEECTCCMPERYFSHRYSQGKRGSMLSVIKMP